MWEMAIASSASSPPLPLRRPSSSSHLPFFPFPADTRRRRCLLPIHSRPLLFSTSIRSSYNGWADLAAAESEPPFSLAHAPLLLLLLLPFAASFSRLPLLAAAFTAGFATARYLPSPSPLLLADLDARLLSLRDHLASSKADTDAGVLLQALDRARDGLLQYMPSTNTTAAAAGDVAREVAGYFGGWARDTLRDMSVASPRKKPREFLNIPAAVVDAKSTRNSDAAAQSQQRASELSSFQPNTRHTNIAQGKPFGSAVAGSTKPLDMLPFNGKDAHGLEDSGPGAQTTHEDDMMERLLFLHRYGRRNTDVLNDDPFEGHRFATESSESSLLERTLEIRDRSYKLKIERHSGGGRRSSKAQERPADEFVSSTTSADDEGATISSDGEEFSINIKEAAEILRKARECMLTRADEETADALLNRSARLLSTAVALRPTSLVAVGQLGNTYLLHGELKLKISRELRTLLASRRAYLNGRERVSRPRKLDTIILSKENISSALVDVCEECESLLVEAGRSYRMAVSIDSGDIKALYNWGLALIFRAQLLADIGPEAAVDADRVYLAAIDKFDAMLSKSSSYAPEALYRWGSALQQRSQLRCRNTKEKIRLLEQAKSLFEDVLYVEADNKIARESLSTCISELNYHGQWL